MLNIPANLWIVLLPPYSPELNPVEHIWDEVREKYFGNLVFDSLDALEDHLETALRSHNCLTNYSTIKAVEKQHVAVEVV